MATDTVSPSGYLFDDVATDSVDEGDIGVARMSGDRVAYGRVLDGHDVAGGTTTDAAVVTDASGTRNAFLRGLVKLLAPLVSTSNSTTVTLAANGTFTGTGEDVSRFGSVSVIMAANVASAASGVKLQWSPDNTNWDAQDQVGYNNNGGTPNGQTLTVPVRAQYYRIVYTNGSTIQASFRLQSLYHFDKLPTQYLTGMTVSGNDFTNQAFAIAGVDGSSVVRGVSIAALSDSFNAALNGMVTASIPLLGTGSSGSTGVRQRTPNIFKTVATAALGATALWTPAAGKKFRLMRYMVTVTDQATQAAPGTVTITHLDAAADILQTHDVYVPAVALVNSGSLYNSGWIDLGNGILSAAINQVLNVNLSAALTAGTVRCLCCGTEE